MPELNLRAGGASAAPAGGDAAAFHDTLMRLA